MKFRQEKKKWAMNRDLQDKYIFDYLEGNLSPKEEALFHDLVAEDPQFKSEFLSWKDTYYNIDTPTETYSKKSTLKKKTFLSRNVLLGTLFGGLATGLIFFTVLNFQLNKDSSEISVVTHQSNENTTNITQESKPEIIQSIKKTQEEKNTISLIQPNRNQHKNPVSNKNVINKPVIKNTISTPFITDSIALGTTNIESKSYNEVKVKNETSIEEPQKVDTIESIISNTPENIKNVQTNDSEEKQITQKKTEKVERVKRSRVAKQIMRKERRHSFKRSIPSWDEIKEGYKDQRVIPVD